jgi:uridine phosphorylase
MSGAPIAADRDWGQGSVFRPENLLREARRQKRLPAQPVPPVCALDPDGDLVRYAITQQSAQPMAAWPCYHSQLITCSGIGFVPHAVGAPYAVLIAEQLFASGCRLLISMTSAGQIRDVAAPPYYVVIERALRDEGTSYHYLPSAEYAAADPGLLQTLFPAIERACMGRLLRGGSWTTDAPFRETASAVAKAAARGLMVVEMEAAGLYAFAKARGCAVLCLAHVSNRLGQEGDFEKGEADGAPASLRLIQAAAAAWRELGNANKSVPR